ncbi:MAG: hypothetical protein JSR58_00175 [Verrucomicrobia bacterium]|nr:hypothetical protein [Verrucomicrobiota bacterium]
MHIGVLGTNYSRSDIAFHEKVVRAFELLSQGKWPAVFLTTCHRAEIYFSGENIYAMEAALFQALACHLKELIGNELYSLIGRDCFAHLISVTSGLDSVIKGESDIQRQVKVAYSAAKDVVSLPSALHFLFQKSLKVAKEIRSQPSWNPKGSLEKTVSDLVLKENPKSILIVGNSQINRKIIHHLHHGAITLCTRTPQAAESFALDHGLSLCDTRVLEDWASFDVVISATHASSYLIRDTAKELKTRLILDLSVPRTVDPLLRRHALTIRNMEDLRVLMQNNDGLEQPYQTYIQEQAKKQIEIYLTRTSLKTVLR